MTNKSIISDLFPFKTDKKTALLNTVYLFFMISFVCHLIIVFVKPFALGSWNISEFLINYECGFVRRGLTGEILFFLTKYLHFDVIWTVKILCLALFSILLLFFVKKFKNQGYSLYVIPLCFFTGALVINYDYWVRKDCLLMLIFIAILKILIDSDQKFFIKILYINILVIIAILIHEVFVFLILPVLFLLLTCHFFKKKALLKSTCLSGLCIAFPAIVFLLTVFNHGTPEISQCIWESWLKLMGLELSPVDRYNGLGGIGWSAGGTFFSVFKSSFLYNYHGIYSGFEWIVTFPVIYYLSSNLPFFNTKNRFDNKQKTCLSAVILFQFIVLLPVLLFLMNDYGRVSFFWMGSAYAINLIVPPQVITNTFPKFYINWVDKLNQKMNKLLPPTWNVLIILILFTGLNFTNGDFAASNIMKSSVIYHLIWIPVQIIKLIFNIEVPFFDIPMN